MPGKAISIRERRRSDLEQEIRKVAIDRFKEVGYEELTLKYVCDKVGISLRTIFRYFSTKDEILSYPIVHRIKVITGHIKKQSDDVPIVEAYINATITMLRDENYDPEEVDLIRRVIRDVPSLRARYLIHFGGYAQDEMEEEFARRLGLSVLDPKIHLLRSFLVMASVSAIFTWSNDPASYDLQALSQQFLSMLSGVEVAIRQAR
ncbi:TetR/AcrR family transcriptional regulator [Sphingomonadaceae bacterium G21617-S1]|jgi:AcrR family transcriptional regulator|uniref:TetR/AcrR family transcriptional regulator n=1 Tax=Rhizorhabdus sp. TaxID=1968843 RepID=UPI0022C0574E|nr:TetR/AcrR family transcriptional regulator [Rhizorhabdus sp.]MCZ4343300.1 TetR/AcrR family transcriptional regulator [Sphingomonadaceae bacterium G21617-S1]